MKKIALISLSLMALIIIAASCAGAKEEAAKNKGPKVGNHSLEIDPKASCKGRDGAYGTYRGKNYTCKSGSWTGWDDTGYNAKSSSSSSSSKSKSFKFKKRGRK